MILLLLIFLGKLFHVKPKLFYAQLKHRKRKLYMAQLIKPILRKLHFKHHLNEQFMCVSGLIAHYF